MIVILPLNYIHLRIPKIETTIAIEIMIMIMIAITIVAAVPHLFPTRLCPILVLILITINITHQPQDTTREETRTKPLEQSPTQPSTYLTALTGKAILFPSATLLSINSRTWWIGLARFCSSGLPCGVPFYPTYPHPSIPLILFLFFSDLGGFTGLKDFIFYISLSLAFYLIFP